jgi:hypothetical protein
VKERSTRKEVNGQIKQKATNREKKLTSDERETTMGLSKAMKEGSRS